MPSAASRPRTSSATTGLRARVAAAAGRRGALPALITGLGVFGIVLVQGLLVGLLGAAYTAGSLGIDWGGYAGEAWNAQLAVSLTGALPFALGVFGSFWQLAPIAPELRLGHVVSRAVLAAVVGAAAVVVVVVIVALIAAVAGLPSAFGGGSGVEGVIDRFWFGVLRGVLGAAQGFVTQLPVVVLAAVLLWGWLDRHPLRHDVAGALDEV